MLDQRRRRWADVVQMLCVYWTVINAVEEGVVTQDDQVTERCCRSQDGFGRLETEDTW